MIQGLKIAFFLSILFHITCNKDASLKEAESEVNPEESPPSPLPSPSPPDPKSPVSAEEIGCWGHSYEVQGTYVSITLIIGPFQVWGHYLTSRSTNLSAIGTVVGDSSSDRTIIWESGSSGPFSAKYSLKKEANGRLLLNSSQELGKSIRGDCYLGQAPIPTPEFRLNVTAGPEKSRPDIVTLGITAPPAHEMYITSNPDCTDGGTWEPYQEQKNWTLPDVDGYYSVFAKFRDANGRESYCTSGYYLRDTIPPKDVAVTINRGYMPSLSLRNELTIRSTESENFYITNTPGCGAGGFVFRNMDKYPTSTRRIHTQLWDFTGDTVYVKGLDPLGNEGECIAVGGQFAGLYTDLVAMNRGTAITPTGKALEYVFANGASGFKVWKEQNGFRILRADGTDEWTKILNTNGKGPTVTDFVDMNLGTASTLITGRVCPPHVYIDDSNPFVTQRCLYHTRKFPFQKLNAAGESQTVPGSIGLGLWSNYTNGTGDRRWYVGNIETCSLHGLRLPTAFEIFSVSPGFGDPFPPTNPMPIMANLMGVPSEAGRNTWTATSAKADYGLISANSYLSFGSPTAYDNILEVLCVIP